MSWQCSRKVIYIQYGEGQEEGGALGGGGPHCEHELMIFQWKVRVHLEDVHLLTQVLRFYAYFKEGVDDSPEENYRVRRCQILLYLEDGSLSVVEPKEDNSGLFQGTFLKRHR